MTSQRVFVIWKSPIFHEAVRLLVNHPDVTWAGTTTDYANAHDEVLKLHPETIIVEEIDGCIPTEVMRILETTPRSIRIIGINLDNNDVNIYYRKHRTVGQAKDLLQLILSENN
jgi:hypothetical protein